MTNKTDAMKEFSEWCEREREDLSKAKDFMERPDVKFEENGVSIKEQEIERLTSHVASLDELIAKIKKEHFS